MQRFSFRSAAILALLSLVLPGLLGLVHGVEHEHGLSDLLRDATHSVSSAECDRRANVHIEAAEVVQTERCVICVQQSKTRVLLDRRASIEGAAPPTDALATVSVKTSGTVLVRLRSSRGPPQV